jgi:hypothetical protein
MHNFGFQGWPKVMGYKLQPRKPDNKNERYFILQLDKRDTGQEDELVQSTFIHSEVHAITRIITNNAQN